MSRHGSVLLGTMLFLLCGCETEPPQAGADTVTSESWTGDAVVEIGEEEGATPYLFESVVAAFIDSDSNVFVVDNGSREIRVFGEGGSHARTFGGMGSGPGEFMSTHAAWIHNDTTVVWDVLLGRVSLFHTDGTLIETLAVSTPFTAIPVGRFADGSFLVVQPVRHSPMPPGDVQSEPARLYRINLQDSMNTRIGTIAWEPMAAGISPVDAGKSMYATQPYGRTTRFAVADSFFYENDGSSWTVYKRNMAGVVIDSLVIAQEAPREITTSDRDRWIERMVAGAEADYRTSVRRFVTSLTLPDHYPTIDALLLDRSQNLWARAFSTDSTRNQWYRVGPDGRTQAANMPPRFRPTMIGYDRIAGVSVDSTNVERITIYRLVQPQAQNRLR